MEAVVERLIALIDEHAWGPAFDEALARMADQAVPCLSGIRTLTDYLTWIDDLVRWAPREQGDSRLVHDKMVQFHFLLDQSPLRELQTLILPTTGAVGSTITQTPLSRWILDFVRTWGDYLDTPASAEHIDSFRSNPAFHWDEYMPPPSGYRTFNQFFARHVRPGQRPVAANDDASVLVSPADAVFIGSWRIAGDSTIRVDEPTVDVKGLSWSIGQLLADSAYAGRFAGGMLMHQALRTYDYHRWHAPLPGRILEATVVQGQAWLDVEVVTATVDGVPTRVLHAIEGTGYQFLQMRAVVVIDSPCGLVACVPVGMGHVSSVVVTAAVGVALRKGEEMGYFQFGGSDFVMVFERGCNVELTCRADQHYVQGSAIGRLHR